MFACQKHESVEGVSTDPPPEPDVVVDDGKNEGYAYLAGNPFHERRMDELTGMANVLATVNSLRYRGFELSPENSFTMCGVADDASVTVTFIALAGGGERAGQSATLACYDSGGELRVSSIVSSANPPDNADAWQLAGDPAWYRVGGGEDISLSPERVDWWDWQYFQNCVVSRAPAAAAGCALTCLTVPGYFHCFMVCVAGQSLAAAIGCIVEMYFGAGKDKKEE